MFEKALNLFEENIGQKLYQPETLPMRILFNFFRYRIYKLAVDCYCEYINLNKGRDLDNKT